MKIKSAVSVLICALCGLFPVAALAQNHITASITVTNLTTNGMTFTVNGSVRTFTNNVVLASVQVLTNADATGSGSMTNLFKQIALNPFALVQPPAYLGSNTFSLTAVSTNPLVVTASAGYASVSYSTQTVSSAIAVRIPTTIEAPAVRTNIDSGLVAAINDPANTNSLNQNATVASQLLGTNKTQVAFGQTTLSNPNNQIYGIISSLGISGNSVLLTNGLYLTPIFLNPAMTNGVNYGNAFSSPGSGSFSEQFGNGAVASGSGSFAAGPSGPTASGDNTTVIGNDAFASKDSGTSIGAHASVIGVSGTAVGLSSLASGFQSSSFGFGAVASGTNAAAFGASSSAAFDNSTAVGTGAATTAANQVMLGSPGSSAVVPNSLAVGTNLSVSGNATISGFQTNATFTGTNNFPAGSDIAFARKSVASLAGGNNSAVPIGTNVFIEVSGPASAFTITGIAGGRDGKLVTLLNQTGFQMTIANESGSDPAPGNRIRTLGAAADLVLTNAAVNLIYSANNSRWIVISHNP